MTNEEIVKCMQSGDLSRYEELEKRFHPMIWSAIHRLKLFYDKDECFQIARIRFYECCMSFDTTRNVKLSTYVSRSIYNILLNYIRDNNFKDADVKNDYVLDEYVFDNQGGETFDYIISNLPEDEQTLLREYYVEGRTLVELGAKYNQSFRWISQRIKVAVAKLRGDYI